MWWVILQERNLELRKYASFTLSLSFKAACYANICESIAQHNHIVSVSAYKTCRNRKNLWIIVSQHWNFLVAIMNPLLHWKSEIKKSNPGWQRKKRKTMTKQRSSVKLIWLVLSLIATKKALGITTRTILNITLNLLPISATVYTSVLLFFHAHIL